MKPYGHTRDGVCMEFLHYKTCVRGDGCQFSHNVDNINVCLNFLKNVCEMGHDCELSHDLHSPKIPICSYIKKKQKCTKPDCNFKHVVKRCPNYDNGYCYLGAYSPYVQGPKCPYVHVERKICMNYMYGFCPEGPECLNAQ